MVGNVLRVRYELTQLLVDGPIFATYVAQDRLQGREICIRLIRPPFSGEAAFIKAIREVVERYSQVQHPGVETILEIDEDEGDQFLISELTQGSSIAERIRKLAPFSVPVAVSTAISLCDGLEALHSVGLAHGDISSQTVVSLPDGQVRVQLPGMWQAYGASQIAGGIVLTAMSPYLAPEVSAGGMPSPASDVYSAGVLLYELLTGRLPYNAETAVSMALKHATGSVPSVRMFNPSVPTVLDEIVRKALSKEPATRYATAGALLTDLRVLQDALRFGRTVTWPITPETVAPQINSMPKTTASRSEPVTRTNVKVERDVPLVLWFLIAIFGAPAAMLLGIWIWFNMSRPTQVKIPSLGGMTVAEARERVKGEKLIVDIDSHKPSEKVPEEHIISTDPPSGESVREGSHIRVVLSDGSQLMQVPNLTGKTPDDAKAAIEAAHLELDDNIDTEHSKKIESGMVMSQSPSAGTKLMASSKVKIVVSTGPDSNGDDNGADSPPPPGSETNTYTLRVTLSHLDKPVTLRIDIVDDRGTRVVYEQEHEPGETVELATRGTGKKIKFRIYYDNQMVREVPFRAEEGSPVAPQDQDNIQQ